MKRRTAVAVILSLPWVRTVLAGTMIDPSVFVSRVDGKCPDGYVYSRKRDHCVPRTGECLGYKWRCTKDHHPFFICDPDVFTDRPQRCCRKNRLAYKAKNCHGWKPVKTGEVSG